MISYHFPAIFLRCYCGIQQHEKIYPQTLQINLFLNIDTSTEQIESLKDTLNYADFLKNFLDHFEMRHFTLIEDIGGEIATFCRQNYPLLHSLRYDISKEIPHSSCKKIIFSGEVKI